MTDLEDAKKAFAEIYENCKAYKADARLEGMLVQEMAPQGVEMIVGVTSDDQFGEMVLVGMGGIFVEVFKDVAVNACPVSKQEASDMIRNLKSFKLLNGYRGSEPLDIDALTDIVVKVSEYALENKDDLAELDLNPVIVYPKGKGVKVVDALIVRYE